MQLEHTLTYDELSQAWAGFMSGSFTLPGENGKNAAFQAEYTWRSERFCGMSPEAMSDAIDHGYVVPGMDVKTGRQTRDRRKSKLSEDEGELLVDLALSGHDRPYMHRPKVKRQAGLTINFELAMTAATPASVLSDYAQFMASLVAGMQAKGFDLAINVVSRAKQVGVKGEATQTTVKVKRFGKRSDLKSWGAMLSPGGFRMLIFCGRILTCHANDRVCDTGMGCSYGPAWGLAFDAKDRVLTVKCKASSSRFPREQLEAELAALPI